MIRNIRHPHLLDVQFALRWGGCLVFAMPLCEQSLADRLRKCQEQGHSGLPKDELLRYMRELAEAIDYLNDPRHPVGDGEGPGHGRLAGVQHRDVKPQNAFLMGGSVRLADFGLAKLMEASLGAHSGCMSPYYVAPEELHGLVSRHSDQYALAVTYCQLRTGRLPYVGSIGEVLEGHLHRAPDLSYLADGERPVVGRAMAKRRKSAGRRAKSSSINSNGVLGGPVEAIGRVWVRLSSLTLRWKAWPAAHIRPLFHLTTSQA